MNWLWDQLHDCFDTNDGSLPEFRVTYFDRQAMVKGFRLLRDRAANINESASFWSVTDEADRAIDSVPNAAALVVSGEAEAFHFVACGIRSGATVLPDLGVFVFDDELALDYRMGPDWGPAKLCAFFDLVADLTSLDSDATLSFAEQYYPGADKRLTSAWRKFQEERTKQA